MNTMCFAIVRSGKQMMGEDAVRGMHGKIARQEQHIGR